MSLIILAMLLDGLPLLESNRDQSVFAESLWTLTFALEALGGDVDPRRLTQIVERRERMRGVF